MSGSAFFLEGEEIFVGGKCRDPGGLGIRSWEVLDR